LPATLPVASGEEYRIMSMIQAIRTCLKRSLSEDQREKLMRFQARRFRGLQHLVLRCLFGSNLKALAAINNTDKWGSHWYVKHYETHFRGLHRKRLNVLEIGIGGYEDPELGGESLRMWRTYFPNSMIYGIDIFDKSVHDERRVRTFRGSQVDEAFLEEVVQTIGKIDIVIDDGSHMNEHVIRTFQFLFPRLSDRGIYVIEDTQTSYWAKFGGSSEDFQRSDTTMGFAKQLVDGLNHAEFRIPGYLPTYYDTHISEIHFYHNIIFIQKGLNNEGTNFPDR
jgi:hypothetical protein